jgi:hypothetical protein
LAVFFYILHKNSTAILESSQSGSMMGFLLDALFKLGRFEVQVSFFFGVAQLQMP